MSVEEMQNRIVQLEVDQSIPKTELIDVLREMESQKRGITDIVEREFAMVKTRIDSLLKDTQREINNLSAANKDLLDKTARAVDILETRLRMVENKAGAVDMLETRLRVVENRADSGVRGDYGREARDTKTRGYLPFKSTIPEPLGNEPSKWRAWKMDALGYFDSTTRGMKVYLLEIEKSPEDISEDWAAGQASSRGMWASADKELLWRALNAMTVDEPKKIVAAVPDDGWNAWRRLCQYFNPSLASMEGRAWAELGMMAQNTAKSPDETKRMIN